MVSVNPAVSSSTIVVSKATEPEKEEQTESTTDTQAVETTAESTETEVEASAEGNEDSDASSNGDNDDLATPSPDNLRANFAPNLGIQATADENEIEVDESGTYTGTNGDDDFDSGLLPDKAPSNVTIDARGGDDDVFLSGRSFGGDDKGQSATVDTGEGNNYTSIRDYDTVNVSNGSGRDTTSIYSSDDVTVTDSGGRNFISVSGANNANVTGGTDEDYISLRGDNLTANGGAGDDSMNFNGETVNGSGGAGDDSITVNATEVQMSAEGKQKQQEFIDQYGEDALRFYNPSPGDFENVAKDTMNASISGGEGEDKVTIYGNQDEYDHTQNADGSQNWKHKTKDQNITVGSDVEEVNWIDLNDQQSNNGGIYGGLRQGGGIDASATTTTGGLTPATEVDISATSTEEEEPVVIVAQQTV